MSKRMQATARFVAVGILAVLLTGCIKLNIDFTVSSDNTVNGTMVFAFSKQLLQLTGQSAQALLASSAPIPSSVPGLSAKPYDDGTFAGEEYTLDAVPLTQFSSDPSSPFRIVRSGDTFTLSGVLDLSSGAGVSGASGAIPGLDQALAGADIRISITFPGEVTDTNGVVDGTTVTWRPKIGERLEIHATASAIGSGSSSSSIVLIGLIALGVIAVIVVVMLVMKGRRSPAPGADTAESMTPMPPSEAPAMQAPPSIPPPSMPAPPPPAAPMPEAAPPETPAPTEMPPPEPPAPPETPPSPSAPPSEGS
jgi:hypothetical protein